MQIHIDFQKVILQAHQIEELADALKQECSGNLENALTYVASAWTGDASDTFMQKGLQFQDKMGKTAADLSKTAIIIREIAEQLYNIEQQAQQIAATREY